MEQKTQHLETSQGVNMIQDILKQKLVERRINRIITGDLHVGECDGMI